MGLGAATVAAVTSLWKASAHSAVAGHAAAAGLLVLGPLGLIFVSVLPAVLWSRVASGAHTPAQVLAGSGVGASFAFLFLA
jgi:membrane-associated phospholipid phosphatase